MVEEKKKEKKEMERKRKEEIEIIKKLEERKMNKQRNKWRKIGEVMKFE